MHHRDFPACFCPLYAHHQSGMHLQEYASKLKVVKIEHDKNPALIERYKVRWASWGWHWLLGMGLAARYWDRKEERRQA
jgi:hypothetical protein